MELINKFVQYPVAFRHCEQIGIDVSKLKLDLGAILVSLKFNSRCTDEKIRMIVDYGFTPEDSTDRGIVSIFTEGLAGKFASLGWDFTPYILKFFEDPPRAWEYFLMLFVMYQNTIFLYLK